MTTELPLRELRASVKGPVHAPPFASSLGTDYGGYGRGTPDIVVEATSEDDVRAVLRTSREHGIPVTVRGAGHSSNGRLAVAQGGILLVNRATEKADITLNDGIADVEARARWDAVERRLNQSGAAVRVLTDTLALSVGGTISVGGYGVRSVRWGAQIDNVESLRLILPDGTGIECSADNNSDHFRLALAGLGCVGVIERVRLHTKPMPVSSRVYVSTGPTWRSILDAVGEVPAMPTGDTLNDAPMEMVAICSPRGTSYLRRRYYFVTREAAARASSPRLPLIARATAGPVERVACFSDAAEVDRWIEGFPRTRKVWADYLLGYAEFREFMAEIERRVTDKHPGHRHLPSVYVLAIRLPNAMTAAKGFVSNSPLSPTGAAAGAFWFGCGLYHMIPDGDEIGLRTAIDACQELVDLCIELGGRPYLHGVASMTETVRRRVYGDDYDALLRLRQRHDPDGLLNPGWFSEAPPYRQQ